MLIATISLIEGRHTEYHGRNFSTLFLRITFTILNVQSLL